MRPGISLLILFSAAIDAPGGFLFEWWSVFWDIFIARTNEKHSDVAHSYIEVSTCAARICLLSLSPLILVLKKAFEIATILHDKIAKRMQLLCSEISTYSIRWCQGGALDTATDGRLQLCRQLLWGRSRHCWAHSLGRIRIEVPAQCICESAMRCHKESDVERQPGLWGVQECALLYP